MKTESTTISRIQITLKSGNIHITTYYCCSWQIVCRCSIDM